MVTFSLPIGPGSEGPDCMFCSENGDQSWPEPWRFIRLLLLLTWDDAQIPGSDYSNGHTVSSVATTYCLLLVRPG